MDRLFNIIFLDEAFEFISHLDKKQYEKILFNIRKAQTEKNPKLFKKVNEEIWEFRTQHQRSQYRLLAFWDKTNSENSLVISTHGFIKKSNKIPEKEIHKAIELMNKYFKGKENL